MGKAVLPITPAFHGNMHMQSFFNEQLSISFAKALTTLQKSENLLVPLLTKVRID